MRTSRLRYHSTSASGLFPHAYRSSISVRGTRTPIPSRSADLKIGSRRLLTFVRLTDAEVGDVVPRVRREVNGDASDLNSFRKRVCMKSRSCWSHYGAELDIQYFEGFKPKT